MSLLGFSSRNHPQQTARRKSTPGVTEPDRTDEVDDRGTNPALFSELSERFGGFTLDVAAAAHNAKCERYFDRKTDGLEQSWAGERVWCNPPYSDIRPWVDKAWQEVGRADLIVMLLPANRTEQAWWQDAVEPFRDAAFPQRITADGVVVDLRCEFLRGRQRFVLPGNEGIGANERPPFGCCLLIWRAILAAHDREAK